MKPTLSYEKIRAKEKKKQTAKKILHKFFDLKEKEMI